MLNVDTGRFNYVFLAKWLSKMICCHLVFVQLGKCRNCNVYSDRLAAIFKLKMLYLAFGKQTDPVKNIIQLKLILEWSHYVILSKLQTDSYQV